MQTHKKRRQKRKTHFSLVPMSVAVEAFETLHSMHAKELRLKMEVAKAAALGETREVLMFYSASWVHEPYLNSQVIVQSLLMETGHQALT